MNNPFAEAYFSNNGWQPHRFQLESWEAIANGHSGLLNAPTGFGKTYAIWFGILQDYYRQEKPGKKRLHALWITPLRALSKEILLATQRVSEDLELDYRVELRTGDTPASARQKQKTNRPHALIQRLKAFTCCSLPKDTRIFSAGSISWWWMNGTS